MNLDFNLHNQFDGSILGKYKIGILRSEWNSKITSMLNDACIDYLLDAGISKKKIIQKTVPGSMELVLGSSLLIEKHKLDGLIALGCIIKGETNHDRYLANAVSNGLLNVSLKANVPVIFGVLTTNNLKQAIDRCGGRRGNKGEEASFSLLKMLEYKSNL